MWEKKLTAYRVKIFSLHVESGALKVQEVHLLCEKITKWKAALASIMKQTFMAKLQHHLPFEECLWADLVNKHLVKNAENIFYQRPADCKGINMKYVKMKAEEDDGHLKKENLEIVYKNVVYDCNGKVKDRMRTLSQNI